MNSTTTPPTTADLRAAYDRARAMRFNGWSFARAVATPLIRKALELSARAHLPAGEKQIELF